MGYKSFCWKYLKERYVLVDLSVDGEGNIKMLVNIEEIISVFVDWIYLAWDRNRRLTVENKLKNSRLSSSGNISL